MSRLILIATSMILAGCSSTIESWKGRPWGSHNFRSDKIYVASADRRIAITGTVDGQKVICPELSPEVAVSRSAKSTPTVTLAESRGLSLLDEITAHQTKAHELDASSQKYAMLHWTLCTAYLNGTIDKATYRDELLKLVQVGSEALTAQANAKPASNPAPKPSGSPAATSK